MQPHRPGTAIADGLSHRNIEVSKQTRVNSGFCHHGTGGEVAPFLRQQVSHNDVVTRHFYPCFICRKVWPAHLRDFNKLKLITRDFLCIARTHSKITFNRVLTGSNDPCHTDRES